MSESSEIAPKKSRVGVCVDGIEGSRVGVARNALRVGPIRPWVSRMAGVTTAILYFVRFLVSAMEAALPNRPAASTQNGEVT